MKGLRIRKSLKLLPGLRINFSKSGTSLSVGPQGARINTGPRGTFLNLDLPGSGISYRRRIGTSEKDNTHKKEGKSKAEEKSQGTPQDTAPSEAQKLDLNFLQRMTMATDEQALLDAVRAMVQGKEAEAYANARHAITIADGAFLAGFLALRQEHYKEATDYLKEALKQKDLLGGYFGKYQIDMTVELPITEDIAAHIEPNLRGTFLALSEAYQELELYEAAVGVLQELQQLDPNDLVVRLALAEIYTDHYPDTQQTQQQIVTLAEGVYNDSPIHCALMYYRAKALRKLGLYDAAQETITQALRRKKDYPDELLVALRYERALIYEVTGNQKKANAEFQKIYAEAPTFEDVAKRVGLAQQGA